MSEPIMGIPVVTPLKKPNLRQTDPSKGDYVEGRELIFEGAPIATVEQTDSGAVISITDKNGTTTATVTNGKDGYTPVKDKDYFDGKNGTSVTVKSVSESAADGGSNVVTFSDGKTVTIKNGKKGNKGDKGDSPVRGTDYWTPADQSAIIQQVIDALGGTPVFGMVDADNNIIISGNLADGTYTLKYENADGTVTEIGTVTVGETMPDSGEVELVWTYGVKLDKTTGAEGSGDGYAASQHIELIDGYTYTFNQVTDTSGATYGGANICYYDANGNGLGYELLWDADANEHSMSLTPIEGAVTFRIRLYCGGTSLNNPSLYNMTYEKTT